MDGTSDYLLSRSLKTDRDLEETFLRFPLHHIDSEVRIVLLTQNRFAITGISDAFEL